MGRARHERALMPAEATGTPGDGGLAARLRADGDAAGGPVLNGDVSAQHRDFAYEGVGVRVETPDASMLEWLEEFLLPAFALPSPPTPVDHVVRIEVNADGFSHLLRLGPHRSGSVVDGFMMDRGALQLPLWNTGGHDGSTVFDQQLGVFYHCDVERQCTRVVAASSTAHVRVAAMRVVRELAMSHVHDGGGVILHAAAFQVKGCAIAIAGPKRAGKTTLLVHALRSGALDFIANDRVAVGGTARRAVGRGIPTIVNLRVSTVACFAGLEERLVGAQYHYGFTVEEAAQRFTTVASVPKEAWSLTPAQFCQLVGAHLAVRAPLAAIVFPRVASDVVGIELHEMPKTAAISAILDALFPAPSSGGLFGPRRLGAGDDRSAARERCSALLAGVPTYECRLGRRAYADTAWLERVDTWTV
jgi:hypothetical protein